MQIEEIRAIVELMSKHNLSEFKVEAENMRLSLKRGVHSTAVQSVQHQPITIAPQHVAVTTPQDVPKVTSAPTPPEKKNTIDAPIVGTFYSAPGPDAQQFVKVGDKVTPDTVVCIIEAMKVMNEVKAEKTGTIKEILVKNAQSVEYGCPLFVVE